MGGGLGPGRKISADMKISYTPRVLEVWAVQLFRNGQLHRDTDWDLLSSNCWWSSPLSAF